MWNFFEFKRVLDNDQELLNEAAPNWMRGKPYARKPAAPAAAPAAVATTAPPVPAEVMPTQAEPPKKTSLARKQPLARTPAAAPSAAAPSAAAPSGRLTLNRKNPEPEAGISTERPDADPNEKFSGSHQIFKKVDDRGKENRFAGNFEKLNGMIKGHTGPVVFGAQKMMEKLGIQFDPDLPFQLSPSAGAIPEQQLQFNTPTGPIGGVEIVIEDPKMLNKVVDAALRTGRDKREDPGVEEVADIKKQISAMPKSAITTRALRFEGYVNTESLSGKSLSVYDLSKQLGFIDKHQQVHKENPEVNQISDDDLKVMFVDLSKGIEDKDFSEKYQVDKSVFQAIMGRWMNLESTKLLLQVASDSDYPWIEIKGGGDIQDLETTITLDKLPNFDQELADMDGIRYPSIPWLNIQQGIDPSKPMGGMKQGAGPAPEAAARPKMPAKERLGISIQDFAGLLDSEVLGNLDTKAPQLYTAILDNIGTAMDNGELSDEEADQLMANLDQIKTQIEAQWKVDFDTPEVQESLQKLEMTRWVGYNTLLEYYMN